MNTIIAECASLNKKYETGRLNLMLCILDRILNGIDPMLRDVENHIVSASLADMLSASENKTQDSEKYVERLLELFKKCSALVKNAVRDYPRFLTARDKAFKLYQFRPKKIWHSLPEKSKRVFKGWQIKTVNMR
uniref:Cullin-5 n=1 Tax=Glossina palpalis gambiensis TaxID=67801 RepID=A0A1B0AKS6_9MUSC